MPSIASRKSLFAPRRLSGARLAAAGIACAFIGGCAWISEYDPATRWIYRIDVQQGVVVTQEMAAQLRPGLTRDQVRFVLGNPPLTDLYNPNRWDYVYRFQAGRGGVEERRFTVYFDKDLMVRAEGDPLPTEAAFVASRIKLNIDQNRRASGSSETGTSSESSVPDDDNSPTYWERIKGWFGGAPGSGPETPPASPTVPAAPNGPGDRPSS